MRVVNPQFFVIADTKINAPEMEEMLFAVGAKNFKTGDASPDVERLVEIGGRLCYKSFEVGLNANVTKIREGTHDYIGNILSQKHGSVLEHANTSVAFIGVSRIFTHELVRHRAGCAYSQESMRFVRLEDIPMYVPDLTSTFTELAPFHEKGGDHSDWGRILNERYSIAMHRVTRAAEEAITEFTRLLDVAGIPFHIKKTITSALRRMAPGGHTTNILVTANHRAWRHIIEMRTSPGAEVEIRDIFLEVGKLFQIRYPALYQDMAVNTLKDGTQSITFSNGKI